MEYLEWHQLDILERLNLFTWYKQLHKYMHASDIIRSTITRGIAVKKNLGMHELFIFSTYIVI